MTGEPKWHERTSTLALVSMAALAAIALVVGAVLFVVRQADKPTQAPVQFVTPSFSERAATTTPTTTETITSTSPPVTTDINDPDATSSSTTSSSSDTSSGTTPPSGQTRRPKPTDRDEPSTTRRRPRFNETRTLYPRP